jgi:hypothetical protein
MPISSYSIHNLRSIPTRRVAPDKLTAKTSTVLTTPSETNGVVNHWLSTDPLSFIDAFGALGVIAVRLISYVLGQFEHLVVEVSHFIESVFSGH